LIKEVLDFALDLSRKSNGGKKRHVSGREILEAFRSYVLKEFGPMSITVLREWNLHRCEDVGAVVFELIEEGVFGRDASDDISDFDTIYDFEEEFRLPFIPSSS